MVIEAKDVQPGDLLHRWSFMGTQRWENPTPIAWDPDTSETVGLSLAEELSPVLIIYARIRNDRDISFAVIDCLEEDKRVSRRFHVRTKLTITRRDA